MGLDYCYVLLIDKKEKANLWEHLRKNGNSESIYGETCLSIDFELDNKIFEYLRNNIAEDKGRISKEKLLLNREGYPSYFPEIHLGRVGCIFIRFYDSQMDNKLFVQFSAATTQMSILFQDSESVEEWFLNLGKKFGSIVTFIDLEEQGFKFISSGDKECNMLLGDDDLELEIEDEYSALREIGLDYREKVYLY